MWTLYENRCSANCYKARLILAHAGVAYRSVAVDLVPFAERPRALLDATPEGRVPAIIHSDGRSLCESNAILSYFGQGTPLIPVEAMAQAEMLAWMFFEQNQHEPNIATRRYWTSVAADSAPRQDQLAFWLEKGHEALATMERHLMKNDFFAAGRFTIADIALYAYSHVAEEGGFDLLRFPAVRTWLSRVAAQPGHVPL